MIIDLRAEMADFREYVSRLINEHVRRGDPKPGMIHFGFTFDQDGWVNAYLDTRTNASRDGEWTTHLKPETLLPRPHWYEASEIGNLGGLVLIDIKGKESQEWTANPTFKNLANILGEFLRSSVSTFEAEGIFQPLLGLQKLNFSIEEFTGLYGWPIDPEVAKLVEALKLSGRDSSSHKEGREF
jgi:hypothetical protein